MPDTKKYLDIDGLTEYHETAGHSADISLIAADSQTSQALTTLNLRHRTLTPAQMLENREFKNSTNRLCWVKGTIMEVAAITFFGDLQSGQITLYASGMDSIASGKLGIDTSWTIV